MKKIKDIKKSREEKYNNYKSQLNEISEHINKINQLLPGLVEAQNEMLEFMEAAFEIKKEMEDRDEKTNQEEDN